MKTRLILTSGICAALIGLSACSSPPTNRQIGVGAGAVLGGVAGEAIFGGTGGAIGGAAAGALIGNEVGKNKDRR